MANWCHNYTTITHTGTLPILTLRNNLNNEPRGYYMIVEQPDENTLVLEWASKWSPDSKWLEFLIEARGFEVRNVCIELGNHFWDVREGDMYGGDGPGGEPDWRVDRHGLTYGEWDELPDEDPRKKVDWELNSEETKIRFKKDDPDGFAALTEAEINWIVVQEGF